MDCLVQVMEQLFGLVNELLQAHPDTQKRNLSIRTYKVQLCKCFTRTLRRVFEALLECSLVLKLCQSNAFISHRFLEIVGTERSEF